MKLSAKVRARAERMERQHSTRRSEIVAAAKTQFAEKGLNGASMRAIAGEAGFTTGAIYPYFANKEEIYAAVLSDTLSALHQHVSDRIARAAAAIRLTASPTSPMNSCKCSSAPRSSSVAA